MAIAENAYPFAAKIGATKIIANHKSAISSNAA